MNQSEAVEDIFLNYLSKHFSSDLKNMGLEPLLNRIQETKKETRKNQKFIDQFLNTHQDKLELISFSLDNKNHFVLYENAKSDPTITVF